VERTPESELNYVNVTAGKNGVPFIQKESRKGEKSLQEEGGAE